LFSGFVGFFWWKTLLQNHTTGSNFLSHVLPTDSVEEPNV